MQTESEFRRRLAEIVLFDEDGPTVSALLAEARAAGLELAPEPPRLPDELTVKFGRAAAREMGSPYCFQLIQNEATTDLDNLRRLVFEEAVRRYNAFPALEARAARLAAALGELLATVAGVDGDVTPERLRRALAEGRAALAEGGEP